MWTYRGDHHAAAMNRLINHFNYGGDHDVCFLLCMINHPIYSGFIWTYTFSWGLADKASVDRFVIQLPIICTSTSIWIYRLTCLDREIRSISAQLNITLIWNCNTYTQRTKAQRLATVQEASMSPSRSTATLKAPKRTFFHYFHHSTEMTLLQLFMYP